LTYVNRACSNGVTKDLYEPRAVDSIQAWDLSLADIDCGRFNDADAYYWPGAPFPTGVGYTYTCHGWVRPQIESVGHDVDIVMFTFGGNDAGFPSIVMECFVPERDACTCVQKVREAQEWVFDASKAEAIYMRLFRDLRTRMKQGARVIMSSYPYLTLSNDAEKNGVSAAYKAVFEDTCDDGSVEEINAAKVMRQLVEEAALKAEEFVAKANLEFGEELIRFVDVTKEFDGHGLFGYGAWSHVPEVALFEPATFGIAAYEDSDDCYLNDVISTLTRMEWWHPTIQGHIIWGTAISPHLINAAHDAVPLAPQLRSGSIIEDDRYALDIAIVAPAYDQSLTNSIAENNLAALDAIEALDNVTSNFRFGLVTSDGDIIQNLTSRSSGLADSLGSLRRREPDSNATTATDELRNTGMALSSLNWFETGVTNVAIMVLDANIDYDDADFITIDSFLRDTRNRNVLICVVATDGAISGDAFGQTVATESSGLYVKDNNVLIAMEICVRDAVSRPIASTSEGYTGVIGESMVFDAEGSFDPQGGDLIEYQWEFPSGIKMESSSPTISWTFNTNLSGEVYLKVIAEGNKVGIGSSRVFIGTEMSDVDHQESGDCPLDDNLQSVMFLNGAFLNCYTTNFPYPEVNSTNLEPEPEREPLSPAKCARIVIKTCNKCSKKGTANGICRLDTIDSSCNVADSQMGRKEKKRYVNSVIAKWGRLCDKRQRQKRNPDRVSEKKEGGALRKRNVFAHHL